MVDKTIPAMFFNRAARLKEQPALAYKAEGEYRRISWADFGSQVRHAAMGLIRLGLEAGEKVCLLSGNCPAWAVSDLAIIAAGGVNVPIYHTNKGSQISYIVNDAEARMLIVNGCDKLQEVISIRHNMPLLQKIIVISGWSGSGDEMLVTFADLLALGAHVDETEELEKRMAAQQEDDLVSLVYTSGTTGDPKGVMLTHKNFLANVKDCCQIMDIRQGDTCLSFLPLSHVLERMAGYYLMLYRGVCIAYAESFQTVPADLAEVKPELVVSVPRLYEKMYAAVKQSIDGSSWIKKKMFAWALEVGKRYNDASVPGAVLRWQHKIAQRLVYSKIQQQVGGRIRYFISGGAPLMPEIGEFFFALGIVIYEGYGLTETAPVLTVNYEGHIKFGTVGPALPSVELAIAEDGEILARGPNVSAGYYKKPQETRESFRDGWFYTGDIGELDSDGFLKITDRKKDIIVTSGGKNVAPQNVENMLKSNKYITQAVVFGDRRKYLTALIVPNFENLELYARRKGLNVSAPAEMIAAPEIVSKMERTLQKAQQELPGFEQVKKFRLLPQELSLEEGELTPTLKVKRKLVAAKYSQLIESMYGDAPAAAVGIPGKLAASSPGKNISG